MDREAVMAALFDRISGAAGFVTTGRLLEHWSGVAAQPALYVVDAEEEFPSRGTGIPAAVTVAAEIWIYTKGDERADKSRPAALNALLDAVEAALTPDPATDVQDLGGLVIHCWIEGRLDKSPGHVGGQAVAVMPVRMLIPR